MMNYSSERQREVYYALPSGMKNAIASVYGARQRKARYGSHFRQCMDFLARIEFWPNDRLQEHQRHLMREFLPSAIENTPYYADKEVYREYLRHRRFEELPVLPRNDVRTRVEQFYNRNLRTMAHRWARTSGTTGKPLVFPIERTCFQREYAYKAFHYRLAAVDPTKRERIAFCQGHPVVHPDRAKPPFWVYDWANNYLILSSFHLFETNMEAYIRELERFQPVMISGYPTSLYPLALAFKEYAVAGLSVRAIYSTSETLYKSQREVIEEAFGCKVFDAYGNSEMCGYIVECEAGELHLRSEHTHVEILRDDEKECAPGETGRLVCTNFSNRAFPLIRYDIGDIVIVSKDQTSKCGRGGVLIENIVGRLEDNVVVPVMSDN